MIVSKYTWYMNCIFCVSMYIHSSSFSFNWECSKKKDVLVKFSSKQANDRPGKCTNGIYLTSNVL